MPSRSNEKERSELKGGFRGNVEVKMMNKCLHLCHIERSEISLGLYQP